MPSKPSIHLTTNRNAVSHARTHRQVHSKRCHYHTYHRLNHIIMNAVINTIRPITVTRIRAIQGDTIQTKMPITIIQIKSPYHIRVQVMLTACTLCHGKRRRSSDIPSRRTTIATTRTSDANPMSGATIIRQMMATTMTTVLLRDPINRISISCHRSASIRVK